MADNKKRKSRRSEEELIALTRKASAAIDGGLTVEEACKKIGIVGSVFRKYAHNLGITGSIKQRDIKLAGGKIEQGTMKASAFPPRPKGGKGGKRPPKPIDMNDVGSMAQRISVLDRKLRGIDELQKERRTIANRLLKVLQGDMPPPVKE